LTPIPDLFGIKESKRELVRVPVSDLKESPIGTSNLSDTQIDRIRIIHAIFRPVFNISLQRIIESFSQYLTPETELKVWENMAKVFLEFDSLAAYSNSQKRAAFKLILARSMQPESEMREAIDESILEAEAVEFILSKYRSSH